MNGGASSASRRWVAISAMVSVGLLGLAYWSFRSLPRPGTVAIPGERPAPASSRPAWTLDALVEHLKHGDDPAASDRVRAMAQAIRRGERTVHELAGVPVMASILPAWWLQREDVYEISVLVLGPAEQNHELSLIRANQPQSPLPCDPESCQVWTLADGLWLYSYKAYVDSKCTPVAGEVLTQVRPDIRTLDDRTVLARFEELKRTGVEARVAVGGEALPLAIAPRPALASSQVKPERPLTAQPSR